VLYGIHPVAEVLAAGRRSIHRLYHAAITGEPRLKGIMKMAAARGIPVETVPQPQLTQICGHSRHQGIGVETDPFPWSSLKGVLGQNPRAGSHPFLLAVDGITDPHNLGALLRTALCAGVDGVLLPRRQSCGPTPTVSKVSAGALEHTEMVPVTNLVRILDQLKAKGFWIAGLDRTGSQILYTTDFRVPLVLVVGGEGKGIRPLVRTHCDYLVTIPQLGPLNSLNASVAGALAMYEVLRQRQREPRS
jgi:23S rRNA (guanosine2251-2'-O)-methyltransferase